MNVFALDRNPEIAAQYMINKHIVKMVLETAQLLCTTVALNSDGQVNRNTPYTPYKPTHKNHPCAIWARTSKQNYEWLCLHGKAIAREYTARYGKTHKSESVIDWCIENAPDLPDIGLTDFAQAMPDEYREKDAIAAYRAYYRGAKSALLTNGEQFRF